jgi:two-component system response regulator AtoC
MGTSVSRALEALLENGFVSGCSVAIQALNATVGEVAGTDIPVLLQGDSGTGKEVYARLIHRLSPHGNRPLTKLSCTMLEPGQLLASVNRSFQTAMETGNDGSGTLILDGVDELDVDCQRVLLSMLQDQESELSGRPGVRLISTTTRNLEREIQSGRFRRELYFRIVGICLRLPALRERKDDVRGLMEFFLEKHALEMGRKIPALGDEEMELLLNYEWPGNIRELGNLARKMVALGQSQTAMSELKRPVVATRSKTAEFGRNESLKVVARAASRVAERELILKALERTHWNRKQAAKELQVSYKALLYKIKQMDVDGPEFKRLRGAE